MIDLMYYIVNFVSPTYLFSEILCGLCGQEPEAIQRQCDGEFICAVAVVVISTSHP